MQQALDWLDVNELNKAHQAIQKAVRLEKDNPEALQSGRLTKIWRTYGKICDARRGARDAAGCYAEALRCEKQRLGALNLEHLPELLHLAEHPGCAPLYCLQHLQEALVIVNQATNPPADMVRAVKLKLAAALEHRQQNGDLAQALALSQEVLGPADPKVLELCLAVSQEYRNKHRYPEALALLEQAKGKQDPALIPLVKEMAKSVKEPAEKRRALERLLALTEATPGANQADAASSLIELGQLNKKDEPALAQQQFQRAALVFSNLPQPDWYKVFLSWKLAGETAIALNQRPEAATNYLQALTVSKAHNAGSYGQIVDLHLALVNDALVPLNRFQEAETLCKDVLEKTAQNPGPLFYTNVVATYASVLRKQGKTVAAEKLLTAEKAHLADLEKQRRRESDPPNAGPGNRDVQQMIAQRDLELRRAEQDYNEKILKETDPRTVAILMSSKENTLSVIRDKWNRRINAAGSN